jgi:hypothetical protein
MNRFDYAHDALPDWLARAIGFRLPRRLYDAGGALLTVVLVLVLAASIESYRFGRMRVVEVAAQVKFDESRVRLEQRRLAWEGLEQLIVRDRRLRAIRTSGSVLAAKLARIGNALPPGVWAETLNISDSSYVVKGFAVDLPSFGRALDAIVRDPEIGQPQSVIVTREERARAAVLGFELREGTAP